MNSQSRKKAKFDHSNQSGPKDESNENENQLSTSSSSLPQVSQPQRPQSQPQQPRLQSTISSANHQFQSSRFNNKSTILDEAEDSDSENYEDIDYGDDDDDDDFLDDQYKRRIDEGDESQSRPENDRDDIDDEAYDENRTQTNDDRDDEDTEDRNIDDDEDGDNEHNRKTNKRNSDGTRKVADPSGADKEQVERCKYWPECNQGHVCPYYHPTKHCRAFPNCRFGQKCLYIHPPCKYTVYCTRPDCSFAHPIGQKGGTSTGLTNLPITSRLGSKPGFFKTTQPRLVAMPHHPLIQPPACKFGSSCTNRVCPYFHQRSEPCRFGANCLLESCPYVHPSDVTKKKPTSAFKWSAQS